MLHLRQDLEARVTNPRQRGLSIRPELNIDLIVDGGPENKNHVVERFIDTDGINIHRKIALKDILFSNAMAEAANKTVKYHYLLPKNIANLQELLKYLEFAVKDLNSVRPHGSLNGDTPDERYLSLPVVDTSAMMVAARKARKEANGKANCGKCL